MRPCYLCDGTGVFEWVSVKFATAAMALEAGDESMEGERVDIPIKGPCPICDGKGERDDWKRKIEVVRTEAEDVEPVEGEPPIPHGPLVPRTRKLQPK